MASSCSVEVGTFAVLISVSLVFCIINSLPSIKQHIGKHDSVLSSTSYVHSELAIFQIGFSQCGATSLAKFFEANGINTTVGSLEFQTYRQQQPVDVDDVDNVRYFGDFGVYVQQQRNQEILLNDHDSSKTPWYSLLLRQYPQSLYIVNIRNVRHWLKRQYLLRNNDQSNNGDIMLIQKWRAVWYDYLCKLINHFEDKRIMDRVLLFDVEDDYIQKLTFFFGAHGVKLDSAHWLPSYEEEMDIADEHAVIKWNELTRAFASFFEDNNHEIPTTESIYLTTFCVV